MKYFIFFIFVNLFLIELNGFSQPKEEKREKTLFLSNFSDALPYKIKAEINVIGGYDSNVNLSPTRKGDIFEEFLLSLDISRPFFKKNFLEDVKFTIDYDLNFLNYNEITDASNILNHLTFALHKHRFPFVYGLGYDISVISYLNDEEKDFLFHKLFLYIRHKFLRNFYHQFRFTKGYKYYPNKDVFDTLYTTIDKKRNDWRYIFDYTITKNINPKLSLRLNANYSINDSNVIYIDFYDYISYGGYFGLEYKIMDNLFIVSKFRHTLKFYDRTVTLRDYKQKDKLYSTDLGLTYMLNKNSSFFIQYCYNKNSSNDKLNEYFEYIFKSGIRYSF